MVIQRSQGSLRQRQHPSMGPCPRRQHLWQRHMRLRSQQQQRSHQRLRLISVQSVSRGFSRLHPSHQGKQLRRRL